MPKKSQLVGIEEAKWRIEQLKRNRNKISVDLRKNLKFRSGEASQKGIHNLARSRVLPNVKYHEINW